MISANAQTLKALAGLQDAVHELTLAMQHVGARDAQKRIDGPGWDDHGTLLNHRLVNVDGKLRKAGMELMYAHNAEEIARRERAAVTEPAAEMFEADLEPPSIDFNVSIGVTFNMTVDLLPAVDPCIPAALELHNAALRGLTALLVNNLDDDGFAEGLPRIAGIVSCIDQAKPMVSELYAAAGA